MSGVVSLFTWKVAVINLLKEGSHRTDSGRLLTSVETKEMEARYILGDSPEEFVVWLQQRDENPQQRLRQLQ